MQQCVNKKQTGYDNLPEDLVADAMKKAAAVMAVLRQQAA